MRDRGLAMSKQVGELGEKFIVENLPCPNCGNELMRLSPGFPLYDVQCTSCIFRAQVKSARTKRCPNEVFGAGWRILNAALKTGQLIPPLLLHLHSDEGKEKHDRVFFFPLLTTGQIKKYTATVRGRKYEMFKYVGLFRDDVAHVELSCRPAGRAHRR